MVIVTGLTLVGAIVVALVMQKGVWGIIRNRTGLDLFPVRRRLVADSGEAA